MPTRTTTRRERFEGRRSCAAARAAFARDGYQGASLRGIARDAEVDVALISHFFGSKAGLFGAVVEWPFDPDAAVAAMLAGGRREVGARIAGVFVGHWRQEATRSPILALMQASITDATAAALLREFLSTKLLMPSARRAARRPPRAARGPDLRPAAGPRRSAATSPASSRRTRSATRR